MENQNNLIKMYEKRLQNLADVLGKLHSHIENDEALKELEGVDMVKYRTDRINELVKQILESEKQRILIRVLQKLEGVANTKSNNQAVQELKAKNDEILQLKIKISDQLAEVRELKAKQKSMLEAMKQNQEKEEETQRKIQKGEMIDGIVQKNQEIQQLDKQLNQAYKALNKLKKDGEEAVRELSQGKKMVEEKLIKCENIVKKQTEEISRLNQLVSKNSSKSLKSPKLDSLNQQILFLQQQLLKIGKDFSLIKDQAISETLVKIQKMKKIFKKDSQLIKDQLKQFNDSFALMIREQVTSMIKTSLKMEKFRESVESLPEKIVTKVNQIDNQLDYFIENQLIA